MTQELQPIRTQINDNSVRRKRFGLMQARIDTTHVWTWKEKGKMRPFLKQVQISNIIDAVDDSGEKILTMLYCLKCQALAETIEQLTKEHDVKEMTQLEQQHVYLYISSKNGPDGQPEAFYSTEELATDGLFAFDRPVL